MHNQETQERNFWENFKHNFFNDRNISSRRKLYNTLWAIVFGFLISGIIISFTGNNPLLVFGSIFEQGVTTFGNKLISVFIAYLFASLAVAICFKAGIFNIGISGQMMSAGFTTLVIYRSDLWSDNKLFASSIVLAFFVAILIGMFVGSLAGALKAYLGINEVVSTIMLNWVIFFVIKFLVVDLGNWDGKEFLSTPDSLASNLSIGYTLPNFFFPQDVNNSWFTNNWNWILIGGGAFVILCVWFVLSKTSFGYKIKMIGLNRHASEYSGSNQKNIIMLIMAISGGLAGVAGFVWYMGMGGQIDVSEQPLLAGFDAIAISLLVFNNPVCTIFSSFLYGVLTIGSNGLASDFVGMQKEISQVMVGAFVYCAAITVVFTKFNLCKWIKNFFILSRYREYQEETAIYWIQKLKYWFGWFNIQNQINKIKRKQSKIWKLIQKESSEFHEQLELMYVRKYSLKNFDINKLTNEDRENYFEKLTTIKRQKDFKLAEARFFEKNEIKASWIVNFQNKKKEYYELRNLLLKSYHKQKEDIKLAKRKEKGKQYGNI